MLEAIEANPMATQGSIAQVELRLLGGFSVWCNGRERNLPLASQRLLAFLALQSAPMTRAYVSGSLWLDASGTRAAANLRSALWRLRGLDFPVVVATRTHVRLADSIAVDYREALTASRRILNPNCALRGDEMAFISAELLPDWYDEWASVERERLRLLRVHALEQLCRRLTDAGRVGEAIDVGMSAIAAEPIQESAHRALIRAHLAAGNFGAALQQYESYAKLLAEELGLRPSDEMEALVEPLHSRGPRQRLLSSF